MIKRINKLNNSLKILLLSLNLLNLSQIYYKLVNQDYLNHLFKLLQVIRFQKDWTHLSQDNNLVHYLLIVNHGIQV